MDDPLTIYGLDVGAATTMSCRADGELLRNELGGLGTASLVCFAAGGERAQQGARAVSAIVLDEQNAVCCAAAAQTLQVSHVWREVRRRVVHEAAERSVVSIEAPRERRRRRISSMANGRAASFLGRRATVGTGGYDYAVSAFVQLSPSIIW